MMMMVIMGMIIKANKMLSIPLSRLLELIGSKWKTLKESTLFFA